MRILASIFVFLAFCLPAQAQPLTDQSIAQWTESFSELMDWADTSGADPDIPPGPNMFRRSMEAMESTPYYSDISGVLAGHGYDDPLGWGDLSDRIIAAYGAGYMAQAQAGAAAIQPQMMQAMQALLENPNLTQAQKDEILKSMGDMAAMANPPAQSPIDPADIEAVERNRAVIDAVLSDQ